jgi:hypothetical protein
VWSRAGRAADGSTRLALFHDADHEHANHDATLSVIPASVPTGVRRFHPVSGELADLGTAVGELRVRCAPGELVCLVLSDGGRVVPGETVLHDGWTLDTGDGPARPIRVDAGWEVQGWPGFSGVGEYRVRFGLPPADLAWPDWDLVLAEVHTAAELELNGTLIGRFGWPPITCLLPGGLLRAEDNELRVRVASTAANRYYAGTGQQGGGLDPSGLTVAPLLRPRLGVRYLPDARG